MPLPPVNLPTRAGPYMPFRAPPAQLDTDEDELLARYMAATQPQARPAMTIDVPARPMPPIVDMGNVAVLGNTPATAPAGGAGGYAPMGGGGGAPAGFPAAGGQFLGGNSFSAPTGAGFSPLGLAKNLKTAYDAASKLSGGRLPELPGMKDVFSAGRDLLGLGGGGAAAGFSASGPGIVGLPALDTLGSIGAQTAAASGAAPAAAGAGLGGAALLAAPAAIFAAGQALKGMKQPSVGPNYAVRFRPGANGTIATEVGGDNNIDSYAMSSGADWAAKVLQQALGGGIPDSLDGALAYFQGGKNKGEAPFVGFGTSINGQMRGYDTAQRALEALIGHNIAQGRIAGDPAQISAALGRAINDIGTPDTYYRQQLEAETAANQGRDPRGQWSPEGTWVLPQGRNTSPYDLPTMTWLSENSW